MIRLIPDHSARIRRSREVAFSFNGKTIRGREGETVACALLRSGHMFLRHSPRDGVFRGPFCFMGLCQECAVSVDGQVMESCRLLVCEGMSVVSRGSGAA